MAVIMGSGAIGYEERGPEVKESENCRSGVRGCVVKFTGGGEELALLLLTSSLPTSSPNASMLTSPCVPSLHKVLRRSEVRQPPPVCRRRESRLPGVSFSWASPLLDLVSSLFNVELLTDSLVVVVVVVTVGTVDIVLEKTVWPAVLLPTGCPLECCSSGTGL